MSNTIEVTIPDIGDITDAEIIEISVAVGDTVAVEDTLIVLETEKASMDVPSPQAGEVVAINCAEGDKVGEGAAILTLKASAESTADEEVEAVADVPAETPAPVVTEEPASAPEPAAPVVPATEATEQDLIIPDLDRLIISSTQNVGFVT